MVVIIWFIVYKLSEIFFFYGYIWEEVAQDSFKDSLYCSDAYINVGS